MVSQQEIRLRDGRRVQAYDSGVENGADAFTVLWHHGSPQTGALLEPLLAAARTRGIRLLSYGRPAYGGSDPSPGRDVSSAAADVAQIADALGVDRFAVMGASGGGPHALACAALLPERVTGVVCLAGIAPFTETFDWYAGMVSPGGLRAAAAGREARERYAATDTFDENSFTPADWAALAGTWSSLGADAQRAGGEGPDGLIADDLAFAAPWGFDVTRIDAPALFVQGGQDRVIPPSHADWLVRNCPSSELWLRPRDGHVSVLDAAPVAMDWLRAAS
ncbi:alpha/beta fold hydrolase [Micromonospora sp. NBC_01796]|uniref:alpha/beta fold hydrolase n=1 Tax=Micromonospora sp. NBC_01796 TaxID=2975987 RepID=UPI002DD7F963|nr:alpha/beta hydrolase [Micromonospora sp. NBC_01796]WSA86607.1 alpha/beta hydrolase [Micromonospora sp. NBC_01796]